MTARSLLARGMLVGVLAGIAAFVVARLLGEPAINSAIAFESSQHTHPATEVAMPEVFSRAVQSTVGLATAVVVFGTSIGGLFAIAYATAQGRFGRLGARATAALVALAGFLSVYFVPSLKYPANPPAIGNEDTLGRRTALHFGAISVAVLLTVACAIIAKQLAPHLGQWNANVVAVAFGVVLIAAVYAAMPSVHETPSTFPAEVLYRFRVAAMAIQATMWATLGLVFGALTERSATAADVRPVLRAPLTQFPEAAR